MSKGALTDAQEVEAVRLYLDGTTSPVLARKYGTTGVTICRILRRHGVTTRSHGSLWQATPDQVDRVVAMRRLGKTIEEIARTMGCHESTMRKALIGAGVEIRHGPVLLAIEDDRLSEIREKFQRGSGVAALCREYGVAEATMRKALRRAGVNPSTRTTFWTDEKIAEAANLYRSGMSQQAIADLWGVSQGSVGKFLRRLGVISRRPVRRGADHPAWNGGRVIVDGYSKVRVSGLDVAYGKEGEYMPEHRLVMARHLGRPLEDYESVHHIDGDRLNNKLENLQLRIGPHGKHSAFRCRDCGSVNIEAVHLD